MRSIIPAIFGFFLVSTIPALAAPIGIQSVSVQSKAAWSANGTPDPAPYNSGNVTMSQTTQGTFNQSIGGGLNYADALASIKGSILDSGVNFQVHTEGSNSYWSGVSTGYLTTSSILLAFMPLTTQLYDIKVDITIESHEYTSTGASALPFVSQTIASLSQGANILASASAYAAGNDLTQHFGVGNQYDPTKDSDAFHFVGILNAGTLYTLKGSISDDGDNNFRVGSFGSGNINVVITTIPEAGTLTLLGFGLVIPAVAICRNRLKISSR